MLVYPEEGNFPTIARHLLAVAEHPYEVRSVTHPRAGFEVPEELFERFLEHRRTLGLEEMGGPIESWLPERFVEDEPVQEEPRKRRPGRPRKDAQPGKEE